MSDSVEARLDPERLAALVEQLRVHNAQLEQALASRIVIEQAKGVLGERYRMDLDRAFELLRRSARANRMRIHDLAAAVVESPRTPTAIELELVQGRLAKGPFPAPPPDGIN